jgi:hypothetical protein
MSAKVKYIFLSSYHLIPHNLIEPNRLEIAGIYQLSKAPSIETFGYPESIDNNPMARTIKCQSHLPCQRKGEEYVGKRITYALNMYMIL